jgi:protein SCO1
MDFLAPKTALMLLTVSALSSVAFTGCLNSDARETATIQKDQMPYFNTPDFTPQFFNKPSEAAIMITHRIADFSLHNQYGEMVSRNDLTGKIHVADFFFTSCGSICPRMTNNMKIVANAYGNDSDVVMLSYTVTPWQDSVPVLKDYAEYNAINYDNWHLLTGPKSEIYTLARQSYFAEQELGFTKDSTEFLHTEHFILVDKTGRIRGIYNGTIQLDIEQLVQDIELLRQE